jgi:rhamnopyranosyl-N-acetylglucosaminyl-diphospho-decaprenol beta-1,3/1,4-galactofuranosyltransferase
VPNDAPATGRLFGVLVTYRRPRDLEEHLTILRKQTRAIEHLYVVDNAPDSRNRELVATYRAHAPVTYVASPENSGAAGGIAQGLRACLPSTEDGDWIVLLDDDNPPTSDDVLARLFHFATAHARPDVGAVGLTGARFDWRRGRLMRLDDDELDGTIDVDFIGGNQFPTLRAGAVRDVGVYRDELFWGLDDLDYGLRLRAGGYRVLVSGELVRWARQQHGRLGLGRPGPSIASSRVAWRQYYTMRNLIDILRRRGRPGLAARVALTRGVAKGLVNAAGNPKTAVTTMRLSTRAVADGWSGRLGRTLDPSAEL